jgi:hypothetical protein
LRLCFRFEEFQRPVHIQRNKKKKNTSKTHARRSKTSHALVPRACRAPRGPLDAPPPRRREPPCPASRRAAARQRAPRPRRHSARGSPGPEHTGDSFRSRMTVFENREKKKKGGGGVRGTATVVVMMMRKNQKPKRKNQTQNQKKKKNHKFELRQRKNPQRSTAIFFFFFFSPRFPKVRNISSPHRLEKRIQR